MPMTFHLIHRHEFTVNNPVVLYICTSTDNYVNTFRTKKPSASLTVNFVVIVPGLHELGFHSLLVLFSNACSKAFLHGVSVK